MFYLYGLKPPSCDSIAGWWQDRSLEIPASTARWNHAPAVRKTGRDWPRKGPKLKFLSRQATCSYWAIEWQSRAYTQDGWIAKKNAMAKVVSEKIQRSKLWLWVVKHAGFSAIVLYSILDVFECPVLETSDIFDCVTPCLGKSHENHRFSHRFPIDFP